MREEVNFILKFSNNLTDDLCRTFFEFKCVDHFSPLRRLCEEEGHHRSPSLPAVAFVRLPVTLLTRGTAVTSLLQKQSFVVVFIFVVVVVKNVCIFVAAVILIVFDCFKLFVFYCLHFCCCCDFNCFNCFKLFKLLL